MRRLLVSMLILAAALLLIFKAPEFAAGETDPPPPPEPTIVVVQIERTIEGKPIAWWRTRAVQNRRQLNRLRRVLRADPSVDEAIDLAALTWDVSPATLHRKAWCESRKSPRALNGRSDASGLFQFLPSTYANALAAGWMHAHGRGREWECR